MTEETSEMVHMKVGIKPWETHGVITALMFSIMLNYYSNRNGSCSLGLLLHVLTSDSEPLFNKGNCELYCMRTALVKLISGCQFCLTLTGQV